MPWPPASIRSSTGASDDVAACSRAGHLLRVVRVDARIELAGGQQHRRVRRPVDDVVVRRVGQHRREQVGVPHRSELGDVVGAVRIVLRVEHVEDRHGGNDGARDVGVLSQHGAHQQPAVRPTDDREPVDGGDTPVETRCRAQAAKSSKQFCLA